MSSDQEFILSIIEAAAAAKLEILFIGSTAAVLQGSPLMTQDVDLLIRDTPQNRKKLQIFCQELGGAQLFQPSEISSSVKLLGLDVPIDILFDRLPTGQSFESLRACSQRIMVGDQVAVVASLEDIIASKQAANRDKDRAQLPTLKATLEIRQHRLGKEDTSADGSKGPGRPR